MSTSGSVAQNAAAKPGGTSSAAHGTTSPGGTVESLPAILPRHILTPVPGACASAVNSAIESRSSRPASSPAGAIAGPIIAEATADVVFVGSRSVRTSTRCPCSARCTAVLNPITPAPTTTISGVDGMT